MLFTQLYVRVGIVLTRGKHFHNLTTLRRGGGGAYKTSSTAPLLSACTKPGMCHVFMC
jgi:hypothetical protein